MNLPISWVVAGAIPATQAVKQVANLAATSASHFFGELLQANPLSKNTLQAANGRSEQIESSRNPNATSESIGWSERVDSIRNTLSKFVSNARARYGLTQDTNTQEAVAISADEQGRPRISGPEPIRTELEQFLQSRPDLIQEFNELASQSSDSGPLRLLPGQELASKRNDPWKLRLDG